MRSRKCNHDNERVLHVGLSEVVDCVCAAFQLWSAQCVRNISALEVAQTYSVNLRTLFGKNPTRPNFCSIADGAIIRGGIGSPGSPFLILWFQQTKRHFWALSSLWRKQKTIGISLVLRRVGRFTKALNLRQFYIALQSTWALAPWKCDFSQQNQVCEGAAQKVSDLWISKLRLMMYPMHIWWF